MLVALFDDMAQCNVREIERLMQVVSAQRCQYAQKYKFAIDKFCCLKAFEMLHRLVEQCLGEKIKADALSFDFNKNGCPFLKNEIGLHFSISHCKKAVVVAVDKRPIGVDVETIMRVDNEFVSCVMNSSECKKIVAADNPEVAFTLLWTQKEAVLKCNGTGIRDIDELSLVLTQKSPRIQLQTIENIEKGYVYSIASL